jgi:Mg-chelatase subunit ChlD
LSTPKAFAAGWAKDTMRAVAGIHTNGGTSMLPAIKMCAERLIRQGHVSRRILLVLTDGVDSYSSGANAAQCAMYRRRGIEIVGVGLMTDPAHAFGGRAVTVWNTKELSEKGMALLARTLDEGAPRTA